MRSLLTLILMSALVLISFQAVADPPGQMKMQSIISPPIGARFITCTVLNLSDRAIEIELTVASNLSQFRPDSISMVDSGNVASVGGNPLGDNGFCVVEWYGRPGELLGSACGAQWFSDVDNSFGFGCLDLKEVDLGSDVD